MVESSRQSLFMEIGGAMAGAMFLGPPSPAAEPKAARTAYDFVFRAIEGAPLPLRRFRGKVVLVVNTASLCGFTYQYGELQALWEAYRDSGLVVLAIPTNDFGNQEPGEEAEIKEFCEVKFFVDFPMTNKQHAKGRRAHPFYRWAAKELGFAARPRWNFHKYLIGPDGRLVDWFSTQTAPTAEKVVKAIDAQLAAAAELQE